MTRKMLFTLPLLLFSLRGFTQPVLDETDSSTKEKSAEHKTQFKSTARIHTRGMFLYGGRISTDNPAFDINFTYNRPQWGFLIYKAIDLKDHTSPNNFALALVYRNFKFSNKLTFTPHLGIFLEQTHTFVDWGSDILGVALTSYKINSYFSVDYAALLANMALEPQLLDWVNRTRVLFTSNHVDATVSYWHNNHVFDEQDHMSGSLAVNYKIRLSGYFNLNVGANEFILFQTSNEEKLPKTNRFLLTVALQLVR